MTALKILAVMDRAEDAARRLALFLFLISAGTLTVHLATAGIAAVIFNGLHLMGKIR
jgi:hypothetical protein